MELRERVRSALIEIRQAARTNADNPKLVMEKYNLLILGERFNTIYSHELSRALNEHFGVEVAVDQLNELLPEVCAGLGMKYEELVALSDVGNSRPKTASLAISLF